MKRTRMGTVAALAVATLLAGALVAGDAAADWLVLADGSRVETEGTWEVKGRQIVFTTADGTLSSLKTEQVDLDASREATRAAVERAARPATPPPAPAPPPAKPRRKFTNADFPRGAVEPPAAVEPLADAAGDDAADDAADDAMTDQAAAGGGEAVEDAGAADDMDAGAGSAPELPAGADDAPVASAATPGIGGRDTDGVVVTAWDRQPLASGDGIEIAGTLRNDRPGTTATSVAVQVVLFDRSGQQIATIAAAVEPTSISDGGTADFVATFPDVYDFGAVRFNASSRAIEQAAGQPGGATTPNG
ncbi:MAG TPA: FxLYD domain-containing protein [Thermoanaerobaculia bacterium]|nr:FxLYD domain-containing protein [Thermoanaerobaculia bacterium]